MQYLLPAGRGDNVTTALDVASGYGKLPHLLLKMKTVDQLKEMAFTYCRLRRQYDEEDIDYADLPADEKAQVEVSWKHYIAVTKGEVVDGELSVEDALDEDSESHLSLEAMPENEEEVQVHTKMLQWIVAPQSHESDEPSHESDEPFYRIYAGHITAGKQEMSLDLDRKFIHDKLVEYMDDDQIYRYGIDDGKVFYPSYVLEGGNSLRDLPGTNDSSIDNTVITQEAVSSAKLVFVLLKKSLKADQSTYDMLESSRAIEHLLLDPENYKIVFLHCRECGDAVYPDGLLTEQNNKLEEDAEKATREQFHKLLRKVNRNLPEGKCKEGTLQRMKDEAHVKTIYPLLYTSIMLHSESQQSGEDADAELVKKKNAIMDKTNMKWMLGILEMLNQDNIQSRLRRYAKDLIPRLESQLKGVIADATEGTVPKEVLERVKRLLKVKNGLKDRAENMAKRILQPIQAEFLDDLPEVIADFLTPIIENSNPKPQESKEKWDKALKGKRIKRLAVLQTALTPKTYGRGVSAAGMMDIVFGSEHQRHHSIDFEVTFTLSFKSDCVCLGTAASNRGRDA